MQCCGAPDSTTSSSLAAPGSGAQTSSSSLPIGDGQHFWGHSPACILQPHPQTSAKEEEGWELPGCLAELPLCRAGAVLAAGVPAAHHDPRAKTGITVQESNKHGFLRLLHKSSSFQLTLSTRQAAEGIIPEFAGEKSKIRGDF